MHAAPLWLETLLIVLMAAVIVVPLFHRLRWSPVLGYLVAGVVVGPHGLGILKDIALAETLAHYGVVFLLFSIGLELSIERLKLMRRFVFGLGSLQVLLTSLLFGLMGWLGGLPPLTAGVIGVALSFSSTAMVLQLLVERGELVSRHGRTTFAVLLFQDLAVIPMLALVPLLGNTSMPIESLLSEAFLKALLAGGSIILIGRFLLRPVLRMVAHARSADLFSATALLVSLGTAWIAHICGLSMALGAFLAGLLLAGTEYRHEIDADTRPYRVLLLSLFFSTVGMNLDPMLVMSQWQRLGLLLLSLLLIKAAVILGLARVFRQSMADSLRLALLLAGGGEFAFVLFALAMQGGLFPRGEGQIFVTAVALSMALTPLLAVLAARMGKMVESRHLPDAPPHAQDSEQPHAVIAGFGRVGQTVAQLLSRFGIRFTALDSDPERVAQGRDKGWHVIYGHAVHFESMEAVGASHARLAVVAFDDPVAVERTVSQLHRACPHLTILARARDEVHARQLRRVGAAAVIPETIEASLELSSYALRMMGADAEDVEKAIDDFRGEHYRDLLPADDEIGQIIRPR
ncbi:MAG: cation:proton antiporter [Alphaproteobacteria bacterium]|nr:MAG: cation:proton antiporter [Alphaproteobacteria bacterium]